MANDCYTRCFAKRDQSTVMLTPNYFFIFCILIKNPQKMAYIINALYIDRNFEQIVKTVGKKLNFLFRSYKPI